MKTNLKIYLHTATGAQARTAACCLVAIETSDYEAYQADPAPWAGTGGAVPALD